MTVINAVLFILTIGYFGKWKQHRSISKRLATIRSIRYPELNQ